jgi:hypothetical protein
MEFCSRINKMGDLTRKPMPWNPSKKLMNPMLTNPMPCCASFQVSCCRQNVSVEQKGANGKVKTSTFLTFVYGLKRLPEQPAPASRPVSLRVLRCIFCHATSCA